MYGRRGSSYSAAREDTPEELNEMFKTLFLLSVGNVPVNVLLSAIGMFNLGGLFSYQNGVGGLTKPMCDLLINGQGTAFWTSRILT